MNEVSMLLILELLHVTFAVMLFLVIIAGVGTLALLAAGLLVLRFMRRGE